MGPLPKRKYAKAHQGKRRNHIKVSPPVTQLCPQCQSPKLPHRACPTCGYYNGREVVQVKNREKKAS